MASKDKRQKESKDDSLSADIMKRFKTRPFLYIGSILILIIITIAFVFLPALGTESFDGGDMVFGYYNRTPIRFVQGNYFHQVFQNITRNVNLSPDDPFYFFQLAEVWRLAFELTVIHIGILDEVNQAGFLMPPELVDRAVAELPIFHENGRFSPARYRAMDNNSRMTLWRQVQESLLSDQYIGDLQSIRSPSGEAAFIGTMASPQRSFEVAIFPIDTYPESEVIAYANANSELFRNTRLSMITLGSEREAQQILESVRNGVSTFEEAARINSLDGFADRGGDMGLRMVFELIPELPNPQEREQVLNMPRGGISDLLRVGSSWAFFRLEEAPQMANLEDELTRDRVRSYMMNNVRGRIEDWFLSEAEDFAREAQDIGFSQAAFVRNIASYEFGPIPLNYGNSGLFDTIEAAGVPELMHAGDNQFFWRLAFTTPLNTISRPLVVDNNVIVLLPLEEHGAREGDTEYITIYLPMWAGEALQSSYRDYFLVNDKFDNRFEDTFWRLMSWDMF
ncbi:MAG: SurA N-terminal domain-containing protein [Treponema sp.]|nr:SurA N-terminal domain-containing protein [Treponema sp.]